MDLLTIFVKNYCLTGMDADRHLYRCNGSQLRTLFNQELVRFGHPTVGTRKFYTLVRDFVCHIEGGGVIKSKGGNIVFGITMANRIERCIRTLATGKQLDAQSGAEGQSGAPMPHNGKFKLRLRPTGTDGALPPMATIPLVPIRPPMATLAIPPVGFAPTMATIPTFDMAPNMVPLANLGTRPVGGIATTHVSPDQKSNALGILPMSPVEETIRPTRIRLRVVKPKPEGILWDGSHLGRLDPESLVFYCKSNVTHIKYYILHHQGASAVVTRKRTTTAIPSIVDEIKGLLDLPKIGTHSCVTEHGHRYVLRKVITSADNKGNISMIEDFNITLVPEELVTSKFIASVRTMLAFRELLGVTNTQESSIIAREIRSGTQLTIVPISTDESSIDISGNLVIPQSIYEKWFPVRTDDCLISSIIIKMIGVDNPIHVPERLAWLHSGITAIINRIDRQEIGMLDSIMERASSRVLRIFHNGA
jgi:hypothetical protein